MKRIFLFLLFVLPVMIVQACPVCEKQQPKILQGVAHGAGPESQWDYVIVWAIVLIVAVTLFYSLKWLIRPGEKAQNHIKHFIFNAD